MTRAGMPAGSTNSLLAVFFSSTTILLASAVLRWAGRQAQLAPLEVA